MSKKDINPGKTVQNKTDSNYFLLLQINDAVFPIGAYTHSYGLETYIQKNLVHDRESAFEYIKANLRGTFLYTELLAVRFAYEYSKKNKLYSAYDLPADHDVCHLFEHLVIRRFLRTVEKSGNERAFIGELHGTTSESSVFF